MKVSIAITLDGLVTALRYRGYAAAEEAEIRVRRGRKVKPRDRPKSKAETGETRGTRGHDVASN